MSEERKNIKSSSGGVGPGFVRDDDPKPRGIGEWVYEHSIPLAVTVIVYLVLAIVFVTSKIVLDRMELQDDFVIDLIDYAELEKELDEAWRENERLMAEREEQEGGNSQVSNAVSNELGSYGDVRNIISNDEARISELYESDRLLQEGLRGNREMMEQGYREIGIMEDEAKSYSSGEVSVPRGEDVKVEGSVTVSYSLGKPMRVSSYLYVPAYRCERGGRVVVDIVVNQTGDVVSANVNKQVSSSDYCMTTTAVDAAQRSRFNADPQAPARQNGSITYIFVPQTVAD